jgi:hypothetical protein
MLGPDVLKEAPLASRSDDTLWRLQAKGRVPVRIDVDVYCHGYLLVRCRATELGQDGLFIEPGPLNVGRRAYLEVEFVLDCEAQTRLYRIPAYIAAERENGVELRFVDLQQAVFRALD